MAKKVFVSFRFSDGKIYKDRLCELFDSQDIIDCSENEDRSKMTEETIKNYLYNKLKRTSITIVLLTPEAIDYQKNIFGNIDDWLYDELKYSLEDREENRTNGVIALYTPEAKDLLLEEKIHKCDKCNKEKKVIIIKEFNNLVRKNMRNVKNEYKQSLCNNLFDALEDSYCSLIPFNNFLDNMNSYIENAINKRNRKDEFNLTKRM